MILHNTWLYMRNHVALTILLLLVIIVINFAMTVYISPIAPGFPLLIGLVGAFIGVTLASGFTPQTQTTDDINRWYYLIWNAM